MGHQQTSLSSRYLLPLLLILFVGISIFIMMPVIGPCVAALLIAYLINPLVDKLDKHIPRVYSALIIISTFVTVLLASAVILLPLVYAQIADMLRFIANNIPIIKDKITPLLKIIYSQSGDENLYAAKILENFPDNLLKSENIQILSASVKQVFYLLATAVDSGISITSTLIAVFVAPLLLFYVLCEWHNIVETADRLIPVRYRSGARSFFKRIDKVIAAYIRGQASVCMTMALYYTVVLSVVGLNYSLPVGMLTGFLTFIPYLGSLSCSALALVIAFLQFDDWYMWGIVLAIFIVGQVIEGNFIVPLLVGREIELHPIWVIIGLSVCGAHMGFVGLLLSIPITAVIGVIIKVLVAKYDHSDFYLK